MYFTFQILVSAYKFIYISSLKGDQSSLIKDTVMVLIRYDVHDMTKALQLALTNK